MAKINRYSGDLKAFASNATGTNRTVFESVTQSDVLDDNINAAFLVGWENTAVNEAPTKQDFNALGFTHGQLLAYLHQVGIPEWSGTQEYHQHSFINYNGQIFKCLTNSHISTTPPIDDIVNWKVFDGSINNIQELLSFQAADGQVVFVKDYHSGITGGGGFFVWDSAGDKANHNGGTIIDPDITFPTDWTNQTQLVTWYTAGTGTGVWVRNFEGGINARWFGAKLDLVNDDSFVMQHIFDNFQENQIIIDLPFRSNSALYFKGSYTKLIFENESYIDFHLPNNTDDCFVLMQTSYDGLELRNPKMKFNNTGLDGITITAGKPTFSGRMVLEDSYRDSIAIKMISSSYQWVENLSAGDIEINSAGRHPLAITLTQSGAANGTPFFNESIIKSFEVRGIGRNFASANAISITFDSTTDPATQKVSGLNIGQCNFDARSGTATASVSHAIHAKSVSSGVGSVESLLIKGGGWESSDGAAPAGLKNIEADSGITINSSTILGVINYNWTFSVGAAFYDSEDNYYVENNGGQTRGAFYPVAKTKTSGDSFSGDSNGVLNGFKNSSKAYLNSDLLVASGNLLIDVPYTPLGGYFESYPLIVTLFHQAYRNSLTNYALGQYLVHINNDGTNDTVQSVILQNSSSGATFSFTPASVTFSIPSAGTLRITVPGGADVGTLGSSKALKHSISCMGVGFNDAITNLPVTK